MKQAKWFDFSTSQNIFPSIIERLAGTPVRLEEKFRKIPPGILSVRIDGSWTIKDNAGHLTDLEPLRRRRLDEEQIFMSALHPRLKTPMRTMDLFFLSPSTTIITWRGSASLRGSSAKGSRGSERDLRVYSSGCGSFFSLPREMRFVNQTERARERKMSRKTTVQWG